MIDENITAPEDQGDPDAAQAASRAWAAGEVTGDDVDAAVDAWEAATGFRAERDARTANRVADVHARPFGAGALVEVVDGSGSASIVGAARALLAEVVGWRGRVVAVDTDRSGNQWAKVDWEGRPGGLVLWADRVRVIDEGDAPAVPAAGAAEQNDDQGATVAAGEGEDMTDQGEPEADRPVVVELICEAREGTDTTTIDRAEWGAMTRAQRAALVHELAAQHVNDQGGWSWHIADGADYAMVGDLDAAVRLPADPAAALLALVTERGIDPATLRVVADQVERTRAGHVTEMEANSVRVFSWGCRGCGAEGTGYEVGEEAYAAATAHGPLVADSPFARGPVIVHEGVSRADNENGVSRRMLTGSLQWEPYDGGEWRLAGYGTTSKVDEGDIAGAHAWAAGLMGADDYDRLGVRVVRWECHRDAYGDWWEPVTR